MQAEIRKLAYELFEKSGWIEGRDAENWLEAERIVMERYALQKRKSMLPQKAGKTAKRTKQEGKG